MVVEIFLVFNIKCNLCCSYNQTFIYTILLITLVIINIIINLLYINTFYNVYNWIDLIENKYLGCFLIIIDWVFSRFIFLLSTLSFTIVFCKHINDIKIFVSDLNKCN